MSLALEDIAGWPRERVLAEWPRLCACVDKLVAKFPTEETLEHAAEDMLRGRSKWWAVVNEEGGVSAVIIAKIATVDATGIKRLYLTGFGGERGVEALSLLHIIEDWGRSVGATEVEVVGRKGWGRFADRLGYAPAAHIWRKPIGA